MEYVLEGGMPGGVTLATAADSIPVPPLASLVSGVELLPGAELARPIAVLKPATIPKVRCKLFVLM